MQPTYYNTLTKDIKKHYNTLCAMAAGRFLGNQSEVDDARDKASELIGALELAEKNLKKDSPHKEKYNSFKEDLEYFRTKIR